MKEILLAWSPSLSPKKHTCEAVRALLHLPVPVASAVVLDYTPSELWTGIKKLK